MAPAVSGLEGVGRVRERVRQVLERPSFQHTITIIILINAVTLGAETSSRLTELYGPALTALDRTALAIFVLELLAKLYVYRGRFFREPWNCFDLVVVGIALVPTAGVFSVLRALRVLRVLRLVSQVPSMRNVVNALLAAIPGVLSIVSLLVLVVYVSAVMATKMFKEVAPEHFGDLGQSLWTLFQVMTGESWPDVADTVMAERPAAWIFFLTFILISSFVVLNLFLAVMVSAMENVRNQNEEQAAVPAQPGPGRAGGAATTGGPVAAGDSPSGADPVVAAELAALREEVAALRQLLQSRG